MLRRIVLNTYAGLFSCLFAIVFVAQSLGFLGYYRPLLAIPTTLIVAVLAYWGYQKFQLELAPEELSSKALQNSLFLSSLILVFFVFLLRMLLWPHSELGKIIPVDFLAYHGIKALELARSGSMWNLAIPYGDYPNGYESLIAFGLLLTNDIRILGLVHALIFLLIWLTLALLLSRYAAMPLALALFLSVLLFFIPGFYSLILTVGKNDGCLSLTILIAILHAPIPNRHVHPIGLAYATMLSLATKATGLYILFYLWGLVLFFWWQTRREGKAKGYLNPAIFGLCLALMFTGGLWVIRNYWLMGEILTVEVRSFFVTSLGANLLHPSLYNSGRESFLLLLALIAVLGIAAICLKRFGWTMTFLLLVIAGTFILTPLTAFLTVQKLVMIVQWRFVLHGLLLLALLSMALLWPYLASKVLAWSRILAGLSLIITIGLVLILNPFELLSYDASRTEQFIDPNGTAPSVYDEVARLESGILYMQNGDWFALSYANPNITVTQGTRYPLGRGDIYPAPVPDYAFFIPGERRPEPSFDNLGTSYNWELIYEDATGQLYRRLP
jgi:hypothetical protein